MTVSTSRRSHLLLTAAAIAGTAAGSSHHAVFPTRTHASFVSRGVRNKNNNIVKTPNYGRGHESSNNFITTPIFPNSSDNARRHPFLRLSSSQDDDDDEPPTAATAVDEQSTPQSRRPPSRKPIFDAADDSSSSNSNSTATIFGPLLPLARTLDTATSGWALSYADLHPATPRTPLGQIFLATNFCYAAAGLALGVRGEWTLGILTELAGVVSFWYHYSQLELGKDRSEVRLALLVDYVTAGAALVTGGVYMVQAGVGEVPWEAVVSGGAAVGCLSLCWVWEFGYPYLFWHSLWHVLSAYTGFLVGQEHIEKMGGLVG